MIEDIARRGVVGAGGGGFPTAVKLAPGVSLLLMNAAECEPLIHKDIMLITNYPDMIIAGFQNAMKACKAEKGIICIKKKHKDVIDLLSRKLPKNVSISLLDDFYPAGDEITLIYNTTGKLIRPGRLPVSEGIAVINVETVYNIALEEPVVDKFLTVGGAVEGPKTVISPVGTSYKDVLSRFKIKTNKFILRIGGIMMGTAGSYADGVVTKKTGAIIVLPEDHPCSATFLRYSGGKATERTGKAACDQCTMCTDLCPRFLLGWPVRPDRAMRSMMFALKDGKNFNPGNEFCCECNLCTLVACPEGLNPAGAVLMDKKTLRAGGMSWEGLPQRPHDMAPFRRISTERLMRRLDLLKFKDEGPLDPVPLKPGGVRILTSQHAGAAAVPVVVPGQKVKRHECIAGAKDGISAPVHASISGTVTEVSDKEIVIQR